MFIMFIIIIHYVIMFIMLLCSFYVDISSNFP